MKLSKKLNSGKIKLTKKNINEGRIRDFINNSDGGDRVLSDNELIEERKKIFPSSENINNIYIFAYGSLLWNPTMNF